MHLSGCYKRFDRIESHIFVPMLAYIIFLPHNVYGISLSEVRCHCGGFNFGRFSVPNDIQGHSTYSIGDASNNWVSARDLITVIFPFNVKSLCDHTFTTVLILYICLLVFYDDLHWIFHKIYSKIFK